MVIASGWGRAGKSSSLAQLLSAHDGPQTHRPLRQLTLRLHLQISRDTWGREYSVKFTNLNKEIKALGIIHEDLRRDNVHWSEELGRALIIYFHRSTLKCRPTLQRPGAAKRRLCRAETGDAKLVRVS